MTVVVLCVLFPVRHCYDPECHRSVQLCEELTGLHERGWFRQLPGSGLLSDATQYHCLYCHSMCKISLYVLLSF